MIQWIARNFEVTDDNTFFVTDKTEVDINIFVSIFGEKSPESANELKSRDSENVAGFHKYIDAWDQEGRFNK